MFLVIDKLTMLLGPFELLFFLHFSFDLLLITKRVDAGVYIMEMSRSENVHVLRNVEPRFPAIYVNCVALKVK